MYICKNGKCYEIKLETNTLIELYIKLATKDYKELNFSGVCE